MKTRIVGVAAAVLLGVSGAFAQEPEGWKVEVTPYAWLAGLEGDVTVKGHKADFDKSFGDLFDYVEAAGSLLTVVQYDRFLIWGQIDYFAMSSDALDVEDQPEGGKFETAMVLGELAVGYQIDGWAEGQTFDLLVGVRATHMENELEVYNRGTFKKDGDILDPIVVVRPSMRVLPSLIDGLRFNPTLAIGAGGDSDLVYEMQPQFQYQITDNMAARLGYRRVGYRFKDDNDNELNIDMSGLIVGLGVTF
jgi:opacity protein-like surface antigen